MEHLSLDATFGASLPLPGPQGERFALQAEGDFLTMQPPGPEHAPLNRKKASFLFVLICGLCWYRWITREMFVLQWLSCRIIGIPKIRALLNPAYFEKMADEAEEEAMARRRVEVDKLMSMGPRILQGDMAEVHDVTLTVKGGEIPLGVYVPKTAPGSGKGYKGVVLWFHGGGWMFGSMASTDAIARDVAEASEMIVVSVGYRVSPEVKFPVPVRDCLTAVQWVKRFIWAFGGDRTRIALVGESSGGNLALSTALLMGRSWLPLTSRKSELCAVVAASPPVSYNHAKQGKGEDGEWRSYKRYWTGYGLTGTQMKAYWDWYLSKEKDGRRPLASPLRASKRMLKGLPPVLLLRAEHEVLWDEISELGRRIADADQEVEEIQSKSCVHGTFAKGGDACGSLTLHDTSRFLKEHCS